MDLSTSQRDGLWAPRPPIGFTIVLPDAWTVFDLDPATSDEWVDELLDERLPPGRAAGPERRAVRRPLRRLLREHVRDQRDAGVFLAAAMLHTDGPDPLTLGFTLAWRPVAFRGLPRRLEALHRIQAQAPAGGRHGDRRVEIVPLACGGGVRVLTRELVLVPGTRQRRPALVAQYLVPVLDLDWMAVLTTSTAVVRLEDAVAEAADRIADGLRFEPPA
jgi:hypothetical protein